MPTSQLLTAGVTSFSNVQLLQNFQCVNKAYDKVIHLTEDRQWTLFQEIFILHCKTTQCYRVIGPKFKATTLQPSDDQAL